MIPLEKFAVARNYCCLGYFGPDFDILKELMAARPLIEEILPGLKVYISCRDNFISKFPGVDRLIPSTELKSRRHDFAYFSEIKSDGLVSPIQQLIDGIRSAKTAVQKMNCGSR